MVSEVFSFYKRQFSFYHIAANILIFASLTVGFGFWFFFLAGRAGGRF